MRISAAMPTPAYAAAAMQARQSAAQALQQVGSDNGNLLTGGAGMLFSAVSQNLEHRVASVIILSKEDALSVIDQAQDGLRSAHAVLDRMRELGELACDPTISDNQRAGIEEEFTELLAQLDAVSDAHPVLDGSFGGVIGPDGVAAMGVTGIAVDGDLAGQAKLSIGQKDGQTALTLRIGGQTLTNVLGAGDRECVFDFGGGRRVTIGFEGGVGSLVEGVVTRIGIGRGGRVDLSRTVSADRYPKEVQVYALNQKGMLPKFPKLPDVSAVGLGLHGKSLGSVADAKGALDAIHSALTRIESARQQVDALREEIRKSKPLPRDVDQLRAALGLGSLDTALQALQAHTQRFAP